MDKYSDKEILDKTEDILFWLDQSFINSDDDGDSGDEEAGPDEFSVVRKTCAGNMLQENFPEFSDKSVPDFHEFTESITQKPAEQPLTSTPQKGRNQVKKKKVPKKKQGKPKRVTKKMKKKCEADWRKINCFLFPSDKFGGQGSPVDHPCELETPLEYFLRLIDENMLEEIKQNSNLYAHENAGVVLNLTVEELKMYIGILLLFGVIPMPQMKMFWALETRYPPVAHVMSRNRFQQIRKFLHIADNSKFDPLCPDKLFKVRPFVEKFKNNLNALEHEEYNSIDETMIPFKGRSPLKQYVKNKPHKWGYKLFTRAGASGILYDFVIYTGKNSAEDHDIGIGISGNVVIDLVSQLPPNKNYKVYFDNWFSSLPLSKSLSDKGFQFVGTIRENRSQCCPLKSDKELKKEGRGSYDWSIDANSGVAIVKWLDRKTVCCISNFVGVETLGTCKRWSEKDKKKIDIPRPAIVGEYNKYMGGVDLFDMLVELYRIDLRCKRGYMRILHWGFNAGVVNAWLMYRRDYDVANNPAIPAGKRLTLLEFTCKIAHSLTHPKLAKKKVGRPSIDSTPPAPRNNYNKVVPPSAELRYDNEGHFPEWVVTRGRCQECKNRKTGFSFAKCCKCGVYLCLKLYSDCFYNYHHEVKK